MNHLIRLINLQIYSGEFLFFNKGETMVCSEEINQMQRGPGFLFSKEKTPLNRVPTGLLRVAAQM